MFLIGFAVAAPLGPPLDPGPSPASTEAASCPSVDLAGDGSFTLAGPVPGGDGAFDWPVAGPDGAGAFDAQPFGTRWHLGADLNLDGPDLGAPVRAIGDGCVTFARDIRRGWGNVVRVVHSLPDGTAVESLYAHLDRVDVSVGDRVRRGALLGTVGDAHGAYLPHLHLELRTTVGLPQGHGYGGAPGYVDPMEFIEARRGDRGVRVADGG